MEWCHKSYSKIKRPPKTKPKRHKKINVFEHYSPNICYKVIFFLFQYKYCRLLMLTVLLVILSLAYYYNTMDMSKASSSQDSQGDIHIPFTYMTGRTRTTRRTKTTKVLPSKRSTVPSTQRSKVKSVLRLQNPRVISATKVSTRSPPKLTSAFRQHNKESINPTSDTDCRMFSCFNYSRCPLKGKFRIYLYDLEVLFNGIDGVTGPFREMLSVNNYITSNPKEACLFVVIAELPIPYAEQEKEISAQTYKMVNEATLNTLPHWGRNGENHLLLNLGGTFTNMTGYAMKAQSMFTHRQFRPGFDVVIPSTQGSIPMKGEVWSLSLPMNLARREILLSFQGQRLTEMTPENAERDNLVKKLQNYGRVKRDNFLIHFNCKKVDQLLEHGIDDWAICYIHSSMRKSILRKSTFALILAPSDYTYASTNLLQLRLYEALESGAVPVILGGDRIRLPFEEVLDWRRAVISLPTARVINLKFLLKSMADEDILAFRRHGRMLWERYLGSVQASVDSLLAVIRTRLNIAPQLPTFENVSLFKFSVPEVTHSIKSNKYKRNFTVGLLNSYEQWNLWGDPFALYPQLPWDPILTPEARFLNKSLATRFQEACRPQAGDRPREQFTVVILTYDRKDMLDEVIINVSQLPYVNKILVICNGPFKLARENLPTDVPTVVVHASENSMNNRFVPYDMIETEAVLSLDDDITELQPREIKFAFRVWRQHRDQIVGFFGRNMEWDSTKKKEGFRYSTRNEKAGNQFCQVHMALTGAAFIHRYYFWAYWRILPQSVRSLVDELKNCEDIAMNFLVSHISRKPPIKVESSWAEHLHSKHNKLSRNSSTHYADRNRCMKHFAKGVSPSPLCHGPSTLRMCGLGLSLIHISEAFCSAQLNTQSQVMGYTPLLATHYHVKSIPHIPKSLRNFFYSYNRDNTTST